MTIPHVYFVSFKMGKGYYTYFGLHKTWDTTWKRIYELGLDKKGKYLYGGMLTWKALFIILQPFRIFKEEIQKEVK